MGLVRQVAALLFIIALPVALITTNVRIALNEPRVYEYAIDEYDAPSTTGLPRDELLDASAQLRAYFNNDEELIFIPIVQGTETISLFNPRETAHLRDVKTLVQASFRVQELSVLFILVYIVTVFLWARERSLRTLAAQTLISSLLSLLMFGMLSAIAVVGFEGAFERFHLVAFDNDLWLLDPSRDRLIQMFPDPFWQDISIWIGIGTLAELALLAAGAAIYLGLTRRSDVTYALAASSRA